jgi:AcrR family transcriptional regulator
MPVAIHAAVPRERARGGVRRAARGRTPLGGVASRVVSTETTPPGRLPRGRHGLSREEVVRDQRARILRALAETMVDKGYVGTAVADVLRAAGVSRETFYEQFSSKEDCFTSAYEETVGSLVAGTLEVIAGDDGTAAAGSGNARADGLARLDRAVGTYLDTLAAEPAFARLFLVEIYATGSAVMERRAATQRQVTGLVGTLLQVRTEEERFAAEALVAATVSMVTTRVAANDLDGLRALRGPLACLAVRLMPPA